MSLTYADASGDVLSLSLALNVDGCNKLAKVQANAKLPLHPERDPVPWARRVPYRATTRECRAWAKRLRKTKPPHGLGWLQTRWITFLELCRGYEAF